jgi:branched-chain amino acid transport system ATP-binding protein
VIVHRPDAGKLAELSAGEALLVVSDLRAGYGKMEILHGINLQVGRGQSLCLIGPNGAGKSTLLHAVYGLADVFGGAVTMAGRDITRLGADEKLGRARIGYVLQDNSVFADMTVEENLWMGGYLLPSKKEAQAAAERVLASNPRLADRRTNRAGVLSGGERRLLEISRALIMEPEVLLVDEPSIGLEPRFIDMVFELLGTLQRQGKTIVMVEQNAKKGLEFADIGYVLVTGFVAMAGPGRELMADESVGRLFLGG